MRLKPAWRAEAAQAWRDGATLLTDLRQQVGRRLGVVLALALAAALAEGVGALLLLPMLDALGLGPRPSADAPLASVGGVVGLEGALALFVLIIACASAVTWQRSVAGMGLVVAYLSSVRERLHGALLAQGWPALSRQSGSASVHALTVDSRRAAMAAEHVVRLASAGLVLPVLLAVSCAVSWRLTLAALVLAAVLGVVVRIAAGSAYALGRQMHAAERRLHAEAQDQVAALREIKSLDAAPWARRAFLDTMAEAQASQVRQEHAAAFRQAAQRVGAALGAAVAVWFASGRLDLGVAEIVVVSAIFLRVLTAWQRVAQSLGQIAFLLPGHAGLMRELAAWRAAAEPPVRAAPDASGMIELRGITVVRGEGAERKTAIQDVSLRLPAGGITAVIGPSGAGKTTLAELLAGLRPAEHGEMRVGGALLEPDQLADWRRHVAYVAQEPVFFGLTIRENLCLARPDASEAALWEALRGAALEERVRLLPGGLDHRLRQAGMALSGGERQRLALARALLRDAALLVLDEPSAALDPGTEARVMETLAALRGRATIVVTTHRPAVAAMADQVIALEDGRVVAAGGWGEVRGVMMGGGGGHHAVLGEADARR